MNFGLFGLPPGTGGLNSSKPKALRGRAATTATILTAPPIGVTAIGGPSAWVANLATYQTMLNLKTPGVMEYLMVSLSTYGGATTTINIRLTIDGTTFEQAIVLSSVGLITLVGNSISGVNAADSARVMFPVPGHLPFQYQFMVELSTNQVAAPNNIQIFPLWQEWQ